MGAAASLPMQFDEASLREVLPGLSDVDASEATAAGPVSCENVFLALGTMPPAAIQPALDASVVDVVEATLALAGHEGGFSLGGNEHSTEQLAAVTEALLSYEPMVAALPPAVKGERVYAQRASSVASLFYPAVITAVIGSDADERVDLTFLVGDSNGEHQRRGVSLSAVTRPPPGDRMSWVAVTSTDSAVDRRYFREADRVIALLATGAVEEDGRAREVVKHWFQHCFNLGSASQGADHWTFWLAQGASLRRLTRLGGRLAAIYEAERLGDTLGPCCEAHGVEGAELRCDNAGVLPGLLSWLKANESVQRLICGDESELDGMFIHALAMLGLALDPYFGTDMGGVYGDRVKAAPPKKAARMFAKLHGDHVRNAFPKSAANLDVVRCGVTANSVEQLIGDLAALLAMPAVKLLRSKNGWSSGSPAARTERYHYASLLLNFEYAPSLRTVGGGAAQQALTYGELAARAGPLWEAYAAKLQTWERTIASIVLQYLRSEALAPQSVRFVAEVQLQYKPYVTHGRLKTHLHYKFVRAPDGATLLRDFREASLFADASAAAAYEEAWERYRHQEGFLEVVTDTDTVRLGFASLENGHVSVHHPVGVNVKVCLLEKEQARTVFPLEHAPLRVGKCAVMEPHGHVFPSPVRVTFKFDRPVTPQEQVVVCHLPDADSRRAMVCSGQESADSVPHIVERTGAYVAFEVHSFGVFDVLAGATFAMAGLALVAKTAAAEARADVLQRVILPQMAEQLSAAQLSAGHMTERAQDAEARMRTAEASLAVAQAVAHAKHCTVQLGVYDRGTNTLKNLGSGAILAGGRVLTCAHNVMDPGSGQLLVTENCVVLIGTYAGDAEPAQWAYAAQVLTPLALLREKLEGQLLDLALLQITSTVVCDPPHCLGKAAVMSSPRPPIEVASKPVGGAFFAGMPCLRCAPDFELRAGETHVTVIGYAAAAGSCIFASPENVVNLAGGFLQTRAFIDTGSSGGPVINAAGDIVSVVSQGGGAPDAKVRADVRLKVGGGHEAVGTVCGGVAALAKTRRVAFLRVEHGMALNETETETENECARNAQFGDAASIMRHGPMRYR